MAPTAHQSRRRRGVIAVAACAQCRLAKVRCDAVRPTCSACSRANAICQYATRIDESRAQAQQRRHSELLTLQSRVNDSLTWLVKQMPSVINDCVQELVDGDDLSTQLCDIVTARRSHRLPDQIAPQNSTLAAAPILSSRFDIDISLRTPQAYPWLDSSQMPWIINVPGADESDDIGAQKSAKDIAYWSTVPITAAQAESLMTYYLNVEHPVYGFFDADLFLRDFETHGTEFCSPLLVSALLFWTSCTYSPRLPEVSSLAPAFLGSARILLNVELTFSSPLTVASLMVLTLGCICLGEDTLAKSFMVAGVTMAESMRLIGNNRCRPEEMNVTPESMSMLQHVAWGAFNMSTVYTMHFHDLYSGTFTSFPPLLSTPEPSKSLSTSFASFCRFWCIAHNIAAIYFATSGPIQDYIPLSFAESTFQRLLKWSEELPRDCVRSSKMSHAVHEMHICYHATIMDLFRPFLAQKHVMPIVASSQCRPELVFALSFKHLRSLTYQYHAAYANTPKIRTISWIHGPLYVASTIVCYEEQSTQKDSFLRCIQAFGGLLESHAIVDTFVKGLFAMAVSAKVLTVSEAEAHRNTLRSQHRLARRMNDLRTNVILNQQLALEDREAANAERLARTFDEMLLVRDVLDDRERDPASLEH